MNASDWNEAFTTAVVTRIGISAAVNVKGRIAMIYSSIVAINRGDEEDGDDDGIATRPSK